MTIHEDGLALIKDFEGLRLQAYLCPAGVWTIGYGATGTDIHQGLVWTREQADARFLRDITAFSQGVRKACTRAPNEFQLAAFTSLAFNIGMGAFRGSTALKRHNAGDFAGAAQAITWWNKVGKTVSQGLVRRRAEEAALYLRPEANVPVEAMPQAVQSSEPGSIAKSKSAWAGIGIGSLEVARQAVNQVEEISTGIRGIGLDPQTLITIAGIVVVAAAGVVIYRAVKRRA